MEERQATHYDNDTLTTFDDDNSEPPYDIKEDIVNRLDEITDHYKQWTVPKEVSDTLSWLDETTELLMGFCEGLEKDEPELAELEGLLFRVENVCEMLCAHVDTLSAK